MSSVFAAGIGAVSPAGWGVPALRAALASGATLPVKETPREGALSPLRTRPVPPPAARPAFLGHPRLRRTSPISQFAVAAALEALGEDAARVANGTLSLGVVFCCATGCMIYCRRFYDEVLREPATASPLLFPETVFNAPASHLASYLSATTVNYTLLGDASTFLQGLALGANWLVEQRVDAALVLGGEECDWIVSGAVRRFSRSTTLAEGASAVYLTRQPVGINPVQLACVTDPELYFDQRTRREALRRVRQQLPTGGAGDLLCDGRLGVPRLDVPESEVWQDWTGQRISSSSILGEAFAAGAGWQCVAAIDALRHGAVPRALVSNAGGNEAAIGACFKRVPQ